MNDERKRLPPEYWNIAEAVKISRGNFYYHFKTKDEILDAVIAQRLACTQQVLDLEIPRITLPVMAGRNLAVIAEAAVRDFMLKMKGYDAASAFIERHSRLLRAQSKGRGD